MSAIEMTLKLSNTMKILHANRADEALLYIRSIHDIPENRQDASQ